MSFFDPFIVAVPLEAVSNIAIPTPGTGPWRPVLAAARLSLFSFSIPYILGFSGLKRFTASRFKLPFRGFLGFASDLKGRMRASLGFRGFAQSIFRSKLGHGAGSYTSSMGRGGSSSREVRKTVFRFGWSDVAKGRVGVKVGFSGRMLMKSRGLLFTRERLLEKLAKSQEEVFRLKLAVEAVFEGEAEDGS